VSRRLGEYAAILAGWLVEETDHACRAMYAIHRRHALGWRDRAERTADEAAGRTR
jgi:hypothetical protein